MPEMKNDIAIFPTTARASLIANMSFSFDDRRMLMKRRHIGERTRAPIKDLGTTPGNTLWSYFSIPTLDTPNRIMS
jgi:hypothetical protein